ncbi:unnamed protein product, partial [Musa hybrid cultivar]
RLSVVVITPTAVARCAIPSSAFSHFCRCACLSFSVRRRAIDPPASDSLRKERAFSCKHQDPSSCYNELEVSEFWVSSDHY